MSTRRLGTDAGCAFASTSGSREHVRNARPYETSVCLHSSPLLHACSILHKLTEASNFSGPVHLANKIHEVLFLLEREQFPSPYHPRSDEISNALYGPNGLRSLALAHAAPPSAGRPQQALPADAPSFEQQHHAAQQQKHAAGTAPPLGQLHLMQHLMQHSTQMMQHSGAAAKARSKPGVSQAKMGAIDQAYAQGLKQVKALLDEGILTQEEFEREKQGLLREREASVLREQTLPHPVATLAYMQAPESAGGGMPWPHGVSGLNPHQVYLQQQMQAAWPPPTHHYQQHHLAGPPPAGQRHRSKRAKRSAAGDGQIGCEGDSSGALVVGAENAGPRLNAEGGVALGGGGADRGGSAGGKHAPQPRVGLWMPASPRNAHMIYMQQQQQQHKLVAPNVHAEQSLEVGSFLLGVLVSPLGACLSSECLSSECNDILPTW